MRQIADGEPYKTPATIDDPAVLPEISDALKAMGYARIGASSAPRGATPPARPRGREDRSPC